MTPPALTPEPSHYGRGMLRVTQLLGGNEGGGITTTIASLLSGLDRQRVCSSVVILRSAPVASDQKLKSYKPHYIRKRRGSISAAVKVARYCRQHQIQVLHTHSISGNLYGRLAGLLSRQTKVVTTVHGWTEDVVRGSLGNAQLEWCLARLDLRMHPLSRQLIVVSNWLRERLIERRVSSRKLSTVSHGIDLARAQVDAEEVSRLRSKLKIPTNAPIVGIVGRLTRAKNHALFLTVGKQLLAEDPTTVLLVVGDGPLRGRLEAMARDLGIAENTIFVGWQNNVFPYYHLIDVLVLCSLTEGCPFAVLESMACGTPIVATRITEIPYIVDHGETGILIPPRDEHALARAVVELLGDVKLRERMGRAAQRKAASFSLRQEAERHIEIYRQALSP